MESPKHMPPDPKLDAKVEELKRLGHRNENGSKLFRKDDSQQIIEASRAKHLAVKAARKVERDRKRDQRRKNRR